MLQMTSGDSPPRGDARALQSQTRSRCEAEPAASVAPTHAATTARGRSALASPPPAMYASKVATGSSMSATFPTGPAVESNSPKFRTTDC